MNYYQVEEALQAVIRATIPLSEVQRRRMGQICEGMLLAGNSQISWLARQLRQATHKDSQIQGLNRVLSTSYLCQDYVYQPFVQLC